MELPKSIKNESYEEWLTRFSNMVFSDSGEAIAAIAVKQTQLLFEMHDLLFDIHNKLEHKTIDVNSCP